MRAPQFLAYFLPWLNFRRVGLVIMRVNSVFGVSPFPQRLRLVGSTSVAIFDFLVPTLPLSAALPTRPRSVRCAH